MKIIALLCSCFLAAATPSYAALTIPPQQVEMLAKKIWKNECGGTLAGLTTWNQGEEFASLGIGHFIWYPDNTPKSFHETFPELVIYMKKHGATIPPELEPLRGCPWTSREEFYTHIDTPKMKALRQWLDDTKNLQAMFIAERLEKSLPYMIQQLDEKDKKKVTYVFYRLANEPQGLYALIDYINFKGEGTSPQESYKGCRWGLLQVLQAIPPYSPDVVAAFVSAAKEVLTQRVKNAPVERHEERWLKGWFNRLDTYMPPAR